MKIPHVICLAAACVFGASTFAHHAQKVEGVRHEALASDPVVTVAGYVHAITIDNQVTGVRTTTHVLVGGDGKRYRIGGADQALTPGASYVLFGRANGSMLYVESARVTAPAGARTKAAGAKPQATIVGHLRLGHADNFDGAPSEFFYAIVNASEQRRLALGAALDGLENAVPASVTGQLADDGEFLADVIIILGPPEMRVRKDPAAQGSVVTTSYIVLPVKFPTNAVAPFTYNADAFTTASLNTAVFGAAPASSVSEFYKEGSFGQELLTGVVADNGSGGWLLANVAPPTTCDINAIANAAETAATARGYNLASYIGRVYVFSNNVPGCGWAGLAYVGWERSWIKQTSSLLVIGHEIGHNYGLLHAAYLDCGANVIGGACTSSEYGDPFGTMGNQRAMHFNAAQKDILGWLPAGTVSTHKSGTTSYTLSPIESGGGARYAVKIPASPTRTYWLEYRQPIGFDSGLSAFPNNGTQIRVKSPFESICSGCSDDTEFLDMTPATAAFTDGALVVGQAYVDSTFGITISTIAKGATDLTVTVSSPTRPSFSDVPAVHPNYADIETIYWYGITKGCGVSPLTFCPTGTVSRAEMAIFIERAKRGSAFTGTASGAIFADVVAGYWAGGPIEQLYTDGITSGCALSPLRFCPDQKVSRAEMAIFLMKARYGSTFNPGTATGTVFADVPKTYWAAPWIERANQYGVMTSCATGPVRFCPDSLVPRAEMAKLLKSTFNLTTAPL
jgi:hypothetical protein